jgi:hypothetical protein
MAEGRNILTIIVLMVALAGLMATICFGLSVLLINVVGRLWPTNSESRFDRVGMIHGVSQTRKQRAAEIS